MPETLLRAPIWFLLKWNPYLTRVGTIWKYTEGKVQDDDIPSPETERARQAKATVTQTGSKHLIPYPWANLCTYFTKLYT